MNQLVPVAYRTDPFDFRVIHEMKIPSGMSLAEIVGRVADIAKLPEQQFVVCINGECIESERWRYCRPKVPTQGRPIIVTLHPMPEGGGSLRTIITVLAAAALIAGTGFIGAGGIATLGLGSAATFGAGTLGASLAAAGLGLAGSLALTALTAPPLISNTAAGRVEKSVAGISENPLTALDYLSRVLGRMRVAPQFLSPPYTMLENDEVYVNGIVGLAGAYEIGGLLLNGSDVALFDDFDYSIRQGLSTDTAPDMAFNPLVIEQRPNLILSKNKFLDDDDNILDTTGGVAEAYTKWHVFTVPPPGADGRIVIRLHWPGGITAFQRDADIARGAIPIRVEIKPRSSSTWYKLPEVHFQGFSATSGSPVRQTIDLEFVDAVSATEGTTQNKKTAWLVYWRAAGGHANQRDAEAVYQAAVNNYAAKGVGRNGSDGFTIDVDQTAINPTEDIDVRVRAGTPYSRNSWTIATYVYGTADEGASLFHHYSTNLVVTNQGSPAANVVVESIASYSNENAFDFAGIASIAFKAKGIQIESLSAEFTSIVPVWDGEAWTHLPPTTSQNPAALYRDVLFGDLNSQPVPGEIVDEDNLIAWYEHCETMGYECNAVIQSQSVPQVLQLIASAGWASPRYSDLWGVVIEKNRSDDDIMQMLTPLNSRDIGTSKEYPNLPHAIRAEYFDEDEQYALRDDVIVYASGFDATNARLIESVRYDGITDAVKVAARSQLDLDQLYFRSVRYIRDVHFEGLLTPRGSLIGLTDEVIERPQRYSLVKTVLTDTGGLMTGLILEATIDLAQAATDIAGVDDLFALPDLFSGVAIQLGASIRLDSGAASTHEINEDTLTDTITFVTPFADPGIHAGQIVALGQLGKEYKRCIVMAVEPQEDNVFRLYLADEAPEIHGT
jgi:hypothetical protein